MTKISTANLQVKYYFLLKKIVGAMYLASILPGPSRLQNLTQKCKIFNMFWT